MASIEQEHLTNPWEYCSYCTHSRELTEDDLESRGMSCDVICDSSSAYEDCECSHHKMEFDNYDREKVELINNINTMLTKKNQALQYPNEYVDLYKKTVDELKDIQATTKEETKGKAGRPKKRQRRVKSTSTLKF